MGADGGASTSLIGAFFLGMGEATAEGVSSWNCAEMTAALQAGLDLVQIQTKARPGDKTMMDALTPAVEAFAEGARAGQNIALALVAAALTRVVPGRPGYWLDLGLSMFACYLIGCTLGSLLRDWVLSRGTPAA